MQITITEEERPSRLAPATSFAEALSVASVCKLPVLAAAPAQTVQERVARHWYPLAGAFALSVPAILALLVLPTPNSDTRELFAWGHSLAFSTPKQPPMMQWLGALTERLFAPAAFWAVLVTQLLTLAGLAYTYASLRLLAGRDRAAAFTLLLASSVSVVAAPLPFALNADILQFPFWAAIVFHALCAARTDGPRHWIWLGLACAAALYTKYTALVLFAALAIATAVVGEYRGVWRNRWLYLSAAICLVAVLPHILALPQSGAAGHALDLLEAGRTGIAGRVMYLKEIASGALLYLAPGWIAIAVAFLRGDCAAVPATEPLASLVRTTFVAAAALLIVLVVMLGLRYESRYDLPFVFLAVLAAAASLEFDSVRWPAIERNILRICAIAPAGILAGGALIYGVFTVHPRMQEPIFDAAAVIEADWARHYTCGPAYVLGDFWSANGIAMASDAQALGVPLSELSTLPWYNAAALKRSGAIVVYRNRIGEAEVERTFPGLKMPPVQTLTLPFLRSFVRRSMTYSYFFLPPEGCGA